MERSWKRQRKVIVHDSPNENAVLPPQPTRFLRSDSLLFFSLHLSRARSLITRHLTKLPPSPSPVRDEVKGCQDLALIAEQDHHVRNRSRTRSRTRARSSRIKIQDAHSLGSFYNLVKNQLHRSTRRLLRAIPCPPVTSLGPSHLTTLCTKRVRTIDPASVRPHPASGRPTPSLTSCRTFECGRR